MRFKSVRNICKIFIFRWLRYICKKNFFMAVACDKINIWLYRQLIKRNAGQNLRILSKKLARKIRALEGNGGKAIDPRAARFYGSEEIGLETGREPLWSRYRLDLTDYSRSLSTFFRFLSPSFTLYDLLFAKLDMSTSALTWPKETLSLTYTRKRFAGNFLRFDSISCAMKTSTLKFFKFNKRKNNYNIILSAFL